MRLKVIKNAKIRNKYNQVAHLTQDTIWESDKTQENIIHMRAKRSALSQHVRDRQDSMIKTNTEHKFYNKKDPQ